MARRRRPRSGSALDGTLRHALQRNDVAAFIAFVDSRPAGYLVLSDSTRSLLVDAPCVSIDMLYVDPAHRRLGVGRTLLAAASRYARDRLGTVASLVPAQDRDANRFFARLGFAPETVRRVTSSATLQRKLAGEPGPTRVAIDQVMARRRDLRLRRRHQPPQWRAVGAAHSASGARHGLAPQAGDARGAGAPPSVVGHDDVVADERAARAE